MGDVKRDDGAALIAAERRRQIESEGYTPDHDEGHDDCELAMAAIAYAADASFVSVFRMGGDHDGHEFRFTDPWPEGWRRRPTFGSVAGRVKALTKAGALICAEIDRIQRKGSDHAE